jgi:predicted nucleotidyltransferase
MGIMFWRRRSSPEEDLSQLVESLKKALGSGLKSVTLFGSMASGDFHKEHSDLNVLIIIKDMRLEVLRLLKKPLDSWMKKGHTMPVLVEAGELPHFARSFPIEFLDMLDHHKVLFGDNPLTELAVDRVHLKSQCIHELALLQLKIRQRLALAHDNSAQLRRLIAESISSARAIFRSIARLDMDKVHLNRFEAIEYLGQQAGFDPSLLERLTELRFRRSRDNLDDITEHYLIILAKVEKYLQTK